ncbi:MAG TPA: NADH-quinone oxidoreductase subunit H [Gemmatimonadaceae bacterium]|nr:NADH-quinone oxidoreductase subunit H [Gemmatimonadaceae bacterium]
MRLPPLTAVIALLVRVLAAPSVAGVVSRTRAIMAGRRGPPLWQLYADLWKLARRGVVYSTTTTWMFRLAPVMLVATTIVAASLLPLDGRGSLLRFAGDAVAFAYLLALGRFVLVLAALDTGSSFEGMGASREVTFASFVEPGLFIAVTALAVMAHDLSLSAMLGAAPRPTDATTVSVMVAASVFMLALAECSRVPVDDPATHLELTMVHEVMVLDHSGPDLAMILYANALKLALFAGIIVNVVLPQPRVGGWLGIAVLLGSVIAVGIAVGIVESVMARLRLPKVPLYIAASSALALFGLVLLLR